MPFIVLDEDKTYYMRGLKEYEHDKMFLIDTIKHEQDLYESDYMLDFEMFDANLNNIINYINLRSDYDKIDNYLYYIIV